VLTLIVFTHVSSCKKETGSVGLNAGENSVNMIDLDTFTLVTRTVIEDSVRSENLSYQLLGAYNDAEFGKSKADIVANFSLPFSNFAFPAGAVVDSVVLQLQYQAADAYNGNSSSAIKIDIRELDQAVYGDSIYYSSRSFDLKPATVFSGSIRFNAKDSVNLTENGQAVRYAPHLRINLGNELKNRFQAAGAGDLNSNISFREYFKGIRISADYSPLATGDGAFFYFNLLSSISGIAVYFNDTGKYVFPVSNTGARINLFRHDFSSAPGVLNQLNNSGQDFSETYLQSMAGLKTKIEIPGLLELLNSGVYGILNARFEFSYDPGQIQNGFPAFDRLILIKSDSVGRNTLILDQLLESDKYDGNKKSGYYYPFYISREIQDILNNFRLYGINYNTGFYLIAPTDLPVSASRMKMNMQKGSNPGVKFVVSVLKIK
jgi:hypothetical protein